jgi:uncharacterized protein (TIGR03067 family)
MVRLLSALSVFVAVCAPVAWGQGDAKEAVAKEWKALEGTWEIVSIELQGKKAGLPEERKERLTFRDGTFAVVQGQEARDKGTLNLDPMKKPKTMDMVSGGEGNKGKKALAIYELKGNDLRVCVAAPGQPRPSAFTTDAGSANYITTMRRVKN